MATTLDPFTKTPTEQRNAVDALKSQLKAWGLESLAGKILSFVQQGYENDSLSFLISETPEYKQRFKANDARIAKGLAPLPPNEYLATERAYRSVLQAANLPPSFYDSHDDFANLLSSDISPTELKERADHAFQFASAQDPATRTALKTYYGIDDAHLTAYFLDPSKAQSLINKQALAAEIGGSAAQQGLSQFSKQRAEQYVDQGVTKEQALSGLQNAALVAPHEKDLALRYKQNYSDLDATDEFVGGLASARRKRESINAMEEAQFKGDTQEARAFGVDTIGAY